MYSMYSQNNCHGNCLIFENACEQCQLSRYQEMFCHVRLPTKWLAIPSKVTRQHILWIFIINRSLCQHNYRPYSLVKESDGKIDKQDITAEYCCRRKHQIATSHLSQTSYPYTGICLYSVQQNHANLTTSMVAIAFYYTIL